MTEVTVSCYVCGEQVVEGEDYKIHMLLVHNKEYDSNEAIQGSEIAPAFIINENNEDDYLYKTFFLTFSEKLKEIGNIVEGGGEPVNFNNDEVLEKVKEEDIWQSFENIKSLIMNIESSTDKIDKILDFGSKTEIDEKKHSPQEPKHEFENLKGADLKSELNNFGILEKPINKFVPFSKEKSEEKEKKIITTGNDNNQQYSKKEIKLESKMNVAKLQTLFYCPIKPCEFFTSKDGMKGGKAAIHLKNDHKVNPKDMKDNPGMFKFTKIKVEKHNPIP